MTVELTFDSTCIEPFPFEQRHDTLVHRRGSRSPCYAAGSRSHRRCSEHAIVKTGPHQVFWNHSHCTPDNTANIKQDDDILPELSKCRPGGEHSTSETNITASACVHHPADIAHFKLQLYTTTAKAVPCNPQMHFVTTSSTPSSHTLSIHLLPPIPAVKCDDQWTQPASFTSLISQSDD